MIPGGERPTQPRGRSMSRMSETSHRTTQSIPGAFEGEGDTTIIQDSRRGVGQTEPTELESSLREQLSRIQEEAERYKEYARVCKYKQGQYAHRLIQAEEQLTIRTTEKKDLEEQVTRLQRRIAKLEEELSEADDMEPVPVQPPKETGNVRFEDIRDELRNELRAEFNDMLRNQRETTAITTATTGVTSATSLSEVALLNYRPRAEGPKEPLDGTDVQEYHSWRYAVDHKVEEDAPYYNNDKRKVAYALKNTKSLLFTAMQSLGLEFETFER